jgi:hypothetical protein
MIDRMSLYILLFLFTASAVVAEPVMVQDYEKAPSLPVPWAVNIPNENAVATLSTDDPHEGKQCVKLHYHFLDTGKLQYLGIPNKVAIQSKIHKLHFWIKGDGSKCGYGVQVSDGAGKTHQFSRNTGQGGIIDFSGWKEIVVDLHSSHEIWGGNKNGKMDYPITGIILTISQPADQGKLLAAEGNLYFDALSVDSDKSAAETLGRHISVVSPDYCSEVKGETRIAVAAEGFKRVVVKCWKQGDGFGTDSTVATVSLDEKGGGSFVFPADLYPHGPITVRISGEEGGPKDNCYLQLFNTGGVSWNEGMPKEPAAAARGMALVFADDFDGPLSISSTDPKATYYDHKPPGGWQDFSAHRFAGRESRENPFAQVGTYLRIRASDKLKSAGLISSLKNDATGITASAPCYFECRFMGPNAIGTWPGFWLMTDYMSDHVQGRKVPCDELDIIEAYGGEGPRAPNAFDTYMISPHCWDQGEAGKALEKTAYDGMHNPVRMRKLGIPSTWFETFHTYGCRITESETTYYCDNVEIGHHATFPLSKRKPFFFLIDLATGGGWPVDLSRYNGVADMYVDYVRVYSGAGAATRESSK